FQPMTSLCWSRIRRPQTIGPQGFPRGDRMRTGMSIGSFRRFAGLLLGAPFLLGLNAYAESEVCFYGNASSGPSCQALAQLQSCRVALIKLLPGSLARTQNTTSWQVLAYSRPQTVNGDPSDLAPNPMRVTVVVNQTTTSD